MSTKHHGQEVEDAAYDQGRDRIRQLGPTIPQWLADFTKDIVLAELELNRKSKTHLTTSYVSRL